MAKGLQLRPSDSGCWTVCTAKPFYLASLAGKLPPEEVRDYTDEGSRAHALAEKVFSEGYKVLQDHGDVEMAMHVKAYAENVLKKIKSKDDEHLVETQVPCFYDTTLDGTLDSIIVSSDCKKIFIDDLKYGAGISVQAKHNKQLGIYARSFIEAYSDVYDFDNDTLITMTIFQPRIFGEEAVRLWAVTVGELKEWTDNEITEIAADILSNPEDQRFFPSDDTCRFCRAQAVCKARADHLLTGIESVELAEPVLRSDEPFHPPPPETLSPEQIASVLAVEKGLVKWMGELRKHATQVVYNGIGDVPGYKTVASTKHRVWSDPDEALTLLKEMFKLNEVTTSKVVSPVVAEKLLKGRRKTAKLKKVLGLITKPEGGPLLVPETDKREPFKLDVRDEFEDEEDYTDLL